MEAGNMTDEVRRRVVAIGISRFEEPRFRPLPFAAADARAFAGAFRRDDSIRTLLDDVATASAVRQAIFDVSAAGPKERVVLFAASHAIRERGELCLVTCDGLLSFRDLLSPLWDGPTGQVVLTLDLCRGDTRDGPPTALELSALFSPRLGRTLLLPDDGTRRSHVSGELQAGIWAWHATAAFAGAARDKEGSLTVGTLKSYLADELPRSLSRAYSGRRRQTPAFLAASDDEILDEALPAREPNSEAGSPLDNVRFFAEYEVPVKSLGGFRKSLHRSPSDSLASSRDWVARLAEPDITLEIEQTVARLRQHLGYKRRDLRADGPANGAASVLTPDFTYHVTARQQLTRADRALFRRTLEEFRAANVLGRPGLARAFPQGFQSLYRPFNTPADTIALIDALEDAASPSVTRIVYPSEADWCELELAGFDGRVRIERDGLTVTAIAPAPPAVLATQFALVTRLLSYAGS